VITYSHIIEAAEGNKGTRDREIRKILSGSCQSLYVKYTHAGGLEDTEDYSREPDIHGVSVSCDKGGERKISMNH
jgi:hypothetical protein